MDKSIVSKSISILSSLKFLEVFITFTMNRLVFREAGRLKAIYRLSLAGSIAVAEARIVLLDQISLEKLGKLGYLFISG